MEPPVAASSSAERSGTIAIRRVEGSNAELTCVADGCKVDNPAGDGVEVLERHLSTDEAGWAAACSTMARPRTHTGHLLDHGGWSTLLRICSQTSATSNQRWCRCFEGGLPRRASTSSGSQDTQPGGWPRRGGAGIAASDNPPTTAPSGGSPSSLASSRAQVRLSRTPPCACHMRAHSCL